MSNQTRDKFPKERRRLDAGRGFQRAVDIEDVGTRRGGRRNVGGGDSASEDDAASGALKRRNARPVGQPSRPAVPRAVHAVEKDGVLADEVAVERRREPPHLESKRLQGGHFRRAVVAVELDDVDARRLRRTGNGADVAGREDANLLVAGRIAGFDPVAASSCRLSRTMMQLGVAAGSRLTPVN